MGLFENEIKAIDAFLEAHGQKRTVWEFSGNGGMDWPLSENRTLVLGRDMGIELGNPRDASTSFLIWRNRDNEDGASRVSLLGPDIPQIRESHAPFGKIVIVDGRGFDPENSYERYRRMDQVKYDLHLDGYMMRGVSQFQREWSRVSTGAVEKGFSFRHLGQALIRKYLELDFIISAQVIFITSCQGDVLAMNEIGARSIQIIGAMNKMAEELSFDCDTCDYSDVCSDVAELRSMRKTMAGKERPHA